MDKHYSEEDRRKYLILQCRYYNGEKDDPFAITHNANEDDQLYIQNCSTAWSYESWWVDASLKGKHNFKSTIEEYDFYGCKSFEEDDGTPVTLKAILWNRYYKWAERMEKDSRGFKDWYKSFYQKRETNFQRRTDQRKIELIAKCRYYKGETDNPLACTEDEMMLYYESVWVERMSKSYKEGDIWRNELKAEHLDHLPKKYNLPSSLVGLFLNRYMHWGNPVHPAEGFEDWLQNRYLNIH